MKKVYLPAFALAFLFLTGSIPAAAAYFESATLGPTGVTGPGLNIYNNNFANVAIGVRFQVTDPIQVTAVGAHLMGTQLPFPAQLFASIVSLSGPSAMPVGDPYTGAKLASTTFLPTATSTDMLVPLSVTLGTGYYGLIIGKTNFLFSGPQGTLINDGVASPTNLPNPFFQYFGGNFFPFNGGGQWSSLGAQDLRFIVAATSTSAGSTIPEPASWLTFLSGMAVFGAFRRIRQ